MKILTVQNLCKTYGKGEARVDALRNVSFSLEKGEFAAVVGESGSGKSTLLNCIGALDTPTSGEVRMDGQNLFSMGEEKRTIFRRRNIGFIFQSFNLLPTMNAVENVALPLTFQGMDKSKREKLAEDAIKLVGLKKYRKHKPTQMSGGQQQRVSIARALAGEMRTVQRGHGGDVRPHPAPVPPGGGGGGIRRVFHRHDPRPAGAGQCYLPGLRPGAGAAHRPISKKEENRINGRSL